MHTNKIYCAIDTKKIDEALDLGKKIKNYVGGIKLGLEFFSANGSRGVRTMSEIGLPIFLDLKFFDIENTVLKAIESLNGLPIKYLSIHIMNGKKTLIKAKEKIELGKYDASFCKMQTYYKYNDTILNPPETYYVPFIYKIKPTSKFEQIENADFPVYCDGKRRIRNAYPYVFSRDELEMHHFSFVRQNRDSLLSKFNNCSSKINFTDEKVIQLTDHWEKFKKGDKAMLNGGSKGVQLIDTKTIKPFIKLKF